jgi:hypothetical protein
MSLYRQVLLAQSDPPQDGDPAGALFLARVDLLFAMGALDEAETLITLAGVNEPEVFRRWFDIALIGQRTIAPCAALKARPSLSDDIATRVICLARMGDWNAAAITVSLAEDLGQIDGNDAELLMRFLDPEMFAGLEDPGPPEPKDATTFTLRDSLALPRPDTPLPLPYLTADLGPGTPARQRIRAAERLVRAAAIPPNVLFAAYRGARAASSGGAWGRAGMVQALDAALASGDDARLAAALATARTAFDEAGLLAAFAFEYGDQLRQIAPGPVTRAMAADIRRLLLIAGQPMGPWAGIGPADPPGLRLASHLASRAPLQGPRPDDSALSAAIRRAFANLTPPRQEIPDLLHRIDAGNFAEGLLRALDLLADGAEAAPQDVHEGLYLLRKLGLEAAARRIAVQMLLLSPEPT